MPFFLVTHTSLVEAVDEHSAARTAVNKIRGGEQVTVLVKSDEETAMPVAVEAKNFFARICHLGGEEDNDQV